MSYYVDEIDDLLEKECYIIDFLPETVPANTPGDFFTVEHYFVHSDQYLPIVGKFVRIILKMMCYYRVCVLEAGSDTWILQPEPGRVQYMISEMMVHCSGTFQCLFPEEHALLVWDWGDLCLGIYHPHETMQCLFEKIAFSEGLFWRRSPTMDGNA